MRFVTCRLPDGVEDPAILSQDGTQVWPLSWLGLSSENCPQSAVLSNSVKLPRSSTFIFNGKATFSLGRYER